MTLRWVLVAILAAAVFAAGAQAKPAAPTPETPQEKLERKIETDRWGKGMLEPGWWKGLSLIERADVRRLAVERDDRIIRWLLRHDDLLKWKVAKKVLVFHEEHAAESTDLLVADMREIKRQRRAARAAEAAAAAQAAQGVSSGAPSSGWAIPESIVMCESGGDYNAQNPSGAYGAYQIMPEHWNGGICSDLGRDAAGQDECASRLWNGGSGAGNWSQCL